MFTLTTQIEFGRSPIRKNFRVITKHLNIFGDLYLSHKYGNNFLSRVFYVTANIMYLLFTMLKMKNNEESLRRERELEVLLTEIVKTQETEKEIWKTTEFYA